MTRDGFNRFCQGLKATTRRIIEDVAPRVVQINGTGPPEIVLVESDYRKGARLGVLDLVTGAW